MDQALIYVKATIDHPLFFPIALVLWVALTLDSIVLRGGPLHQMNILKSRYHLWQVRRLMKKEAFGLCTWYLRNKVNHFVFEEVILTALKKRGYKIQRGRRYTGDGGEDGRCWIDGKLYLIQAKRYSGHVDAQHVLDFVALCGSKRCGGLFVTSGKVGPSARRGAKGMVHVINGQRLLDMLAP